MHPERVTSEITQVLERLTGAPVLEVDRDPLSGRARAGGVGPDLLVRTQDKLFAVTCKSSASTESVGAAVRALKHYAAEAFPSSIPLLIVPFMGNVGRRLCEEEGISWLDLSGNACIHAPGLHVVIEGRPNRYPRRGRPRNLFAPKASRIARVLLLEPEIAMTQQDLVRATELTKGYVSKVISRMEHAGLVQRDNQGGIRVLDRDLLLDTWSEAYDFEDHEIHRGHLAVRTPLQGLQHIAEVFENSGLEYAVTGLAAAWLYAPHASFRLITVYVTRFPDRKVLDRLRYRDVDAGANVWLVKPNDIGVLERRERIQNVWCASPLQVYLDLRGHPERSSEAAEVLRDKYLTR